jgi:hypothetical protein
MVCNLHLRHVFGEGVRKLIYKPPPCFVAVAGVGGRVDGGLCGLFVYQLFYSPLCIGH